MDQTTASEILFGEALRSWDDGPVLAGLPLVAHLGERRVLAVAPHADDEVIGCGGTLVGHARSGAWVTVVVVSDGRRGDEALNRSEVTVEERRAREADVVGRRADEAREVAALMGTKTLVLLDQPDTAVAVTPEAVDALARALRDARPEVVYLPWPLDAHRDHRRTFALAAAALREARLAAAPTVRLFEVWTPLVADVAVDITAEWETKEACLRAYRSQFVSDDVGLVHGLNHYRSLATPVSGLVEAFRELDADTFAELASALTTGPG